MNLMSGSVGIVSGFLEAFAAATGLHLPGESVFHADCHVCCLWWMTKRFGSQAVLIRETVRFPNRWSTAAGGFRVREGASNSNQSPTNQALAFRGVGRLPHGPVVKLVKGLVT